MAKRQPKPYVNIDTRDGQVSVPGGEVSNYFVRNIPLWNVPSNQSSEMWRQFVVRQPIASICRDTIANYLNSLDWAIVARDSDQRDELRLKIKHYTKLLERGNAYYYDIDFTSHIEWLVKDLFDLPFGTASEIGRQGDEPNGKVVWIRPLDAGTLSPTLNFDFPVVQVVGANPPVYLPRDFVSRVFLSPRTELRREGWGYAPPERIYLAMEMLYRGDSYYSELLLNTPEAGILDLGDMEKTSAEEWVKSLRDLLYGINPLKIPVLYEHTTQAKWIPFGKPPSEIMYDTITLKYAAIVCAGYGLTLSDIGMPSSSGGGDTLAGTIRMERIGKSSGKGIAKKKIEAYFNKILPDELKFTWIDYDDERNVSKGRARLASAQASDIWIRNKMFEPMELRQQTLADGLVSISVPETIDINSTELFPQPVSPFGNSGSNTKTMGKPVAPSAGGHGEVIPQQILQKNQTVAEVGIAKAVYNANDILSVLLKKVKKNLSQNEMDLWEQMVDEYLVGKSNIDEPTLKESLQDICQKSGALFKTQPWAKEFSEAITSQLISDKTSELVSMATYYAMQKADNDFIAGKAPDYETETPYIDISYLRDELNVLIHDNLINTVSNYATMIAKTILLDGNLDVDATDAVNNNISVCRDVSREVLRSLPQIVNSVYEYGQRIITERLGEQHDDKN